MNKKIYVFCFVLVVILAVFLRFYQLGVIPSGLTNDEVDKGYDAYSILKTGKDQWGEKFPIISFKGFGDYRPPFYTYIIVPFIKMFDLDALSVRFPSAIFGVASIITIYFFARKLFGGGIGFLSVLIFSISPWSIGLSRIGIESNAAIFFLLLSLLFLLKFEKSIRNLCIGIFLLTLTVYTYSAYLLFSFLALAIFLSIYLKYLSKKKLIVALLLFFIFLFPIFSKNIPSTTRFSQVGLINNVESIGLMQELNASRGACLKQFPNLVCKIFGNKITLFTEEFVENYFSHFSFKFLYFEGAENQYSILYKRGLGYPFEAIFLLFGIFYLFKAKKRENFLLLSLMFLSPIPDSLTGEGNYSRASIMLPFLVIIEGLGFFYIIKTLLNFKNKSIKYSIFSLIVFFVLFSSTSFFINYFTYFKDNYSSYSEYGYRELMKDLYKKKDKYDAIYVTRYLNDTKQYIYYLFYNKYDPQSFQSKNKVEYGQDEDGWINVSRIDNIHFIKSLSNINYNNELFSKKVLLVAHPSEFPVNIKIEGEIKDKVGLVRFKKVDLVNLRGHTESKKQ